MYLIALFMYFTILCVVAVFDWFIETSIIYKIKADVRITKKIKKNIKNTDTQSHVNILNVVTTLQTAKA